MKNRLNAVPPAAGGHPLSAAFIHAVNGLVHFFSTERNSKIHAAAAMVVLLSGFIFHISPVEWCCILICIGLVLMAEMMNTAIENICNLIEPNYNKNIKQIKDMAAGAVFISSMISIIIGLIIFIPYLIK